MTKWRERVTTATAVAIVLVAGGALAAGIRNALFETAPVRAGSFTPAIDLSKPETDEELDFGLDTTTTSVAEDTTTTTSTSSILPTTATTAGRSRVTTTSTTIATTSTTSTTIATTTTTAKENPGRGRGKPPDD